MPENFTLPAPMRTAVLFLVFNRPELTTQVFEAIRKAKPPRLYVAADGPRANCEGEEDKVAKVRAIATKVDWPCEVKTLFRDQNLGCKDAVTSGINWFFEQEAQGIILEDDVLPTLQFFDFCEKGLNKFATDSRIGGIGGFVPYVNVSPFLSMHGSVWGWATWNDRWTQNYDEDISPTEIEIMQSARKASLFFVAEKYNIANKIKTDVIDTWDYYWMFSRLRGNQFMILPGGPLTRNLGFDSMGGTHTNAPRPAVFKKLESLDLLPEFTDLDTVDYRLSRIILVDYRRFLSRNRMRSWLVLGRGFLVKPMFFLKALLAQIVTILNRKPLGDHK